MGRQVAARNGGAVKTVALANMPAIAAALQAGKVDAAVAQPGIAADLVAKGAAVEIGKVVDFLPGYQVTVLFTGAKLAQEKPEQVVAFKRAFAKGAADYNAALVDKSLDAAATDAVIGAIHKYVYTDRSDADASRLIREGAMRVSPNAALNRADVLKQIGWLKAQKLVPESLDANALLAD